MSDWSEYVQRFYSLSPTEQQEEWEKLTPEQRAQFEVARAERLSQADPAVATKKRPLSKLLVAYLSLVALGLAVFVVLEIVGGVAEEPSPLGVPPGRTADFAEAKILPEVRSFLTSHPEFGTAISAQPVPDWAHGRRQRVELSTGRNLLFYTKGDAVVTVYDDVGGERTKVWGEYETYEASPPVVRTARGGLPQYTVLFSVERFGGGGRFGDVLVPSLSRATPAEERERVARAIAQKEGLADVTIYSSEDAYKANTSERYLRAHPDALRRGLLGSLQSGRFTPGEALFP